jgi:F0F1-type ATP synthase delta subunit
MNKLDGEKINKHVEDMIEHANHILFVANNCGDDEVKQRVQQVLSVIIMDLDFKLLEPIYKEFPELKPSLLS